MTFSLLSFDVGIKNLSYSLININENFEYDIQEWGIINLIIDETENICCGFRKNGNKCTNKSLFKTDSEYFCKLHKPISKKIKVKKCKKPNCKKIPTHDLKVKLYTELSLKYKHFENCDYVLIELQPVFLGPKMKSMDNAIYDYFLLKSIMNNKSTVIKHISASSKLKIIEGFEMAKKNYKYNKEESIKYTAKLVENTKWQAYFEKFPKKDDLADCFLQALYFIEKVLKSKPKTSP